MHRLLLIGFFICYNALAYGQQNLRELGNLPIDISESSGLIFYNGKLITHNDSGNSAQLFEIDTTSLQVTRTVSILNAENIDWEDITQDDTHIYIGDFGNNLGTRQDLAIYRIAKQEYEQSEEVSAEKINFTYEDQTNFSEMGFSDYDAEAFIWRDDQLVLFTKQWQTQGTVGYAIPDTPGAHTAQRLDSFDVNGLITGATYNTATDLIYLIGYTPILSPFIVRIESATNSEIFRGPVEQNVFDVNFAQIEGIAFSDENTFYVSSEFFTRNTPTITLEQKLFSFDTTDSITEPEPEPEPKDEGLLLFRTYGSNILEYEFTTDQTIEGRAIHNARGQLLQFRIGAEIENNSIDISTLSNAVYYLTFFLSDDSRISRAFSK